MDHSVSGCDNVTKLLKKLKSATCSWKCWKFHFSWLIKGLEMKNPIVVFSTKVIR